jgi:RNA polymerase sigma factor (TIGR02999 family)
MDESHAHAVTTILGAIRNGEESAASRLFPLIYDELRRLAQREMLRERGNHTLQATALVHEVFLRLMEHEERTRPGWESRIHFFHAAAQAMRRILVDHARHRHAERRGGNRHREPLRSGIAGSADAESRVDYIALDDALRQLEAHDPRLAQIVMLRYFAGLNTEQVAQAMDISSRTVKREWACARAWLYQHMTSDSKADSTEAP